ncbi:hypothetical protein HPP92_000831 [Vanilla planifolia]|uniref:Uncharacterized protein n=1 Tax=Vanilla planifolia TaxID=51239 RepID=A0A835RX64_VANPL|nr:hypothetical protein HPP92_000831 [Vanilla planifolia]
MSPKDLPGFYFDPVKNRYFKNKCPLPGSKRPCTSSSTSSQSEEPCISSPRHHIHVTRKKLMKPSKLIQSREINGRLLSSKEVVCNFQQECQKVQASQPEVWRYQRKSFVSDSALEEICGVVQTNQGLIETNLLAMGGVCCLISLHGIRNGSLECDYGINYSPELVWPSQRAAHCGAPWLFSNSATFVHLTSSVSCIRRIGMDIPNTVNVAPSTRQALVKYLTTDNMVTSLGSSVSGGTVYVLNLNEPFSFSENSPVLYRHITKVCTCDCTIWTADASSNGTKATIGTNFGVSLINLETGSSSLVYRSKSDVLAQQFDLSGNVVLCGVRNGAIIAIDLRNSMSKCFEISSRAASQMQYPHKKPRRNLNTSIAAFMSSAVCSVVQLQSDENYFLGSSMDGSIKLFDRRFLNKAIQSYEGNVNSHSRLQLACNPSETLVLSGGEDCFVRIWSIKTSQLVFEENISNCIMPIVCWPYYGDFSYGYDQFFRHGENPYQPTCSWGVWLGSYEGLFYMRGP